MNTFQKFKELKNKKSQEAAFAQEQSQKQRIQDVKDCHALFKVFVSQIKPFNKQTIEGIKVKVVVQPDKNTVNLSLNGKLRYIFTVETKYYSCNCSQCHEAYTGHEGSSAHELSAVSINNHGEEEDDYYFSWYDHTEEQFIESFDKLITDFKSFYNEP